MPNNSSGAIQGHEFKVTNLALLQSVCYITSSYGLEKAAGLGDEDLRQKPEFVLGKTVSTAPCWIDIHPTGACRMLSARSSPRKANPWASCWTTSSPLCSLKPCSNGIAASPANGISPPDAKLNLQSCHRMQHQDSGKHRAGMSFQTGLVGMCFWRCAAGLTASPPDRTG